MNDADESILAVTATEDELRSLLDGQEDFVQLPGGGEFDTVSLAVANGEAADAGGGDQSVDLTDGLSYGTLDTTLATADNGGAVASTVADVEPGEDTHTVENIRVADWREAVSKRLPDDYPDVWLVSDGHRIAVCDHKRPFDGADEPALSDQPRGAVRIEVVESPEAANKAKFDREVLLDSLQPLDDDSKAEIHLDPRGPVAIETADAAVAAAPMVDRSDGSDGSGGGR